MTELTSCCPVDFSVVSRHLKLLNTAGIVSSDKKGKKVYYTARIVDIVKRLREMADAIEEAAEDGYKLQDNTDNS